MRKPKQEQICRVGKDKLGLLANGKLFESATLIHFEKIYLIFMSVCFKSFDISHDFLKTTAPVPKHVIITIYQSSYKSKQFTFKQSKRVIDEEQLLRIFPSLYFEINAIAIKKFYSIFPTKNFCCL